ncbi:MAG: 4-hydroxythreonine-4-phosphate dehydrogenase PdxA [Bacteroidaceae bacterium]|nr:4-hydroxythreonine-4-phosphate dehydrogenase PdxA [Bacteroidaceae bacterium]
MSKPIIAITHGDTNGIGYEVIFKTFAVPEMLDICTPVIYGSPKVAKYHLNGLGMDVNFHIIDSIKNLKQGTINIIPVFDNDVKIEYGQASKEAGASALKALDKAMEDFKAGAYDALVTAPINKNNIQSEEFNFCGHTEYIEERVGDGKEALMILMSQNIRVALATTHLPVSEIPTQITTELIERKVEILNQSLKQDFRILQPRIAVLALNPHAGEEGLLGKEEEEIIIPAIKNLREKKILVYGPYAADGFFGHASYIHFDAILAMYHDQGLAPFKALCAGNGVNYTAGLPIVRTSPDHGTAYDIAGKNCADESSFRQATYSAIDIMRNRRNYTEASANPLPKLFHERRDEGERLRFNIPEKKKEK